MYRNSEAKYVQYALLERARTERRNVRSPLIWPRGDKTSVQTPCFPPFPSATKQNDPTLLKFCPVVILVPSNV